MPFTPERIDHVEVYVRDLEAAVRWYREVLGLEETARWDPEPVMIGTGGTKLALFRLDPGLAPDPAPPQRHWIRVAWRTDEAGFAAAQEHLRTLGIPSADRSTTAAPGRSTSRTRTGIRSRSPPTGSGAEAHARGTWLRRAWARAGLILPAALSEGTGFPPSDRRGPHRLFGEPAHLRARELSVRRPAGTLSPPSR